MEKGSKNDLTIISKSHAHPHTIKKTHAKFQNHWYKTVRGVALARCTRRLYIEGEVLNVEKVIKNNLTIVSKLHAHPHTMKKRPAKFQNDQYKTVRGVALTRGTHCLYIEGEK